MKKEYKLINLETKKETLCDIVTINGFDFYISDDLISGGLAYNKESKEVEIFCSHPKYAESGNKIIATNNPSFDLPKVVNTVEKIAFMKGMGNISYQDGYFDGHSKYAESYPNSNEDMIEFGKYLILLPEEELKSKQLDIHLYIWKATQPIRIYYQ
jgi:hypothetical protein